MFALDAKRMGYDVVTLDPQEHSPCGQVADEQIVAAYDDLRRDRRARTAQRRRHLRVREHRHRLGASPRSARPSRHAVEQRAAHHAGSPAREAVRARVPASRRREFARVQNASTILRGESSDRLSGGAQDRARRLRRQRTMAGRIRSMKPGPRSRRRGGAELIFERKVALACELSVIATRNARDEIVAYPVARERARSRHPDDDDRAGARRCRDVAHARDDGRDHRARARHRRHVLRRVLSHDGRRAAGQRDRAAPAQQRPLHDRRDAVLAVRAARARDLRPAALAAASFAPTRS